MSTLTQLELALDTALFGDRVPTAFEREAQVGKQFANHVFRCRVAPEASPLAGGVYCEIRCSVTDFASEPLDGLPYTEHERVVCGLDRSWKILRFRTTEEAARRLEALCSLPSGLKPLLEHRDIMANWSTHFPA